MELCDATIHELHDQLKKREIRSVDIVDSIFKRIHQIEPRIHAFITLTEERAQKEAALADQKIKNETDFHPLLGIPIALKDIFLTEGLRTTCCSKILDNYIPPYTATTAKNLEGCGTVLVGKLNMDEFAMGSSNENSCFGVVRNPWNEDCVPGGSSGGSSAAVAAGQCIAATGTDTGGSIRQPASLCGTVGIKPTYGRVSRYGVIAFASSLDQVGPITKDVTDAAIMMNALAGYDPKDSTSLNAPVPDYTKALLPDIKGWRVAVPKEYFMEGLDPEVEKAVKKSVQTLEGLGAIVGEVSLPHSEYGIPTYYILATAEASSNLARYDGVRYGHRNRDSQELLPMYQKSRTEGFGSEVKRRIMLGTYVLSAGYYDAYYLKAQKVRTLIRRDFEGIFKNYDVIVGPTSPTAAWRFGEKTDDPLKMYLSDIFTVNVNLAGLPGMSLPCGFTNSGLPIGLQVIAPYLQEEKIFRVSYAYEQATEWHRKRPSHLKM
ncbi:MAG: Asp-tRNA(Asn)/Glu-tRNA(Gln) amidotransferase subunit GatA [Deltaproteobacteria bacterium]|nr:Asp-tRNA(Asn)/Glu-tRNA(Gln) amidotransferase subunit GatA [Deltaproteobacteria bacterium]